MGNNKEERKYQKCIHLYLALQRSSKQGYQKCIRQVIKDSQLDLAILESKLKVIGGEWRIHKTVNARCVETARKWLLKHLIDHPENASFVSTAWRTALLQRECKVTKFFMLDVDAKEQEHIDRIHNILYDKKLTIHSKYESPNGWHYITDPFDTREICELPYVTLLRDGYHYVKTVEEK